MTSSDHQTYKVKKNHITKIVKKPPHSLAFQEMWVESFIFRCWGTDKSGIKGTYPG